METPLDGWLTTAKAARKLGVTPNWVRELMRQGRLRYQVTQLGRLIDPLAVQELAESRTKSLERKQGVGRS